MTSQVVFTLDAKIKAKAMKRAKESGVPFASYLRHAAEEFAEGKSGMGIVRPERFNAKTARQIRTALDDIKNGRRERFSPAFSSAKEMDEWLLKQK